MASIQTKIQKSLTLTVLLGGVISLFILGFFSIAMYKNQSIISTMVEEYSIIGQSDSIIQAYNAVTKNPTSPSVRSDYTSKKTVLLSTLDHLNSVISFDTSRNTLLGIQNTVQNVLNECDTGIRNLDKNEYASMSDFYAKAIKYNEFVAENTRTLLQNELQYLANQQTSLQQTFVLVVIAGFLLFILFATGIAWYARTFASTIARPIIKLDEYAKHIAMGEIKIEKEIELINSDDEISSLARSMNIMVHSLNESFSALQKGNIDLQAVKESLEKKNTELKGMNDVMIGRELKMIELKKEIETLKNRG